MDQNILSGITAGKFHTLHVKDSNGVFQDILVLLSAGGGGANLTATLPLAISNGVISIDLSQYSTSSAITSLLSQKQDVVSTSLTLQNGASNVALTQDASGNLLWGGLELQLRQNAFHQISVGPPLTISGANNVFIDTLFKPSTISVGTGLTAVASDANGTLNLTLDGTENRTAINLIDSNAVVRQLVPSIGGGLV